MSDRGDTWKYLNLDLDTEPILLSRLRKLTLQDVNLNKDLVLDLDLDKKEIFKLLLTVYKEDLAIAKQVLNTIYVVQKHIVTTVSTCNIVYINNKTLVY